MCTNVLKCIFLGGNHFDFTIADYLYVSVNCLVITENLGFYGKKKWGNMRIFQAKSFLDKFMPVRDWSIKYFYDNLHIL